MNEETIESVLQEARVFQPPAGPWAAGARISSLEAYEGPGGRGGG